MFQSRRQVAVILTLLGASVGYADPKKDKEAKKDPKSGNIPTVVVNPIRTNYPIALPLGDGDPEASKEVQEVSGKDFSLTGSFDIVDPGKYASINLKAEGLAADPVAWKATDAYAVVKYRITATEIEFRLFEVSKGNKPQLYKTYSRKEPTRAITHVWNNAVYKHLTKGENGFFGSKIAFTLKARPSKIMVMDFDGHKPGAISNNSSPNILPAFSPGGGVAYTSFMRDNPDLYMSNGAGRPTKISAQRGMNTGAAFSPDGSKIALTLSKDGNPEIYVISAGDGSIIKRLTENKAIDTSPTWSPDGTKIAFVSDRNGGPQIFVTSSTGGGATQVSFNGGNNTTPSWSPIKGKSIIAYTTQDKGAYDIVTLDLDKKELVKITQSMGNNEEPSFSPNGKSIAFARSGQGIFIAKADGTGTPVQIWKGVATGVDWGPAPPP